MSCSQHHYKMTKVAVVCSLFLITFYSKFCDIGLQLQSYLVCLIEQNTPFFLAPVLIDSSERLSIQSDICYLVFSLFRLTYLQNRHSLGRMINAWLLLGLSFVDSSFILLVTTVIVPGISSCLLFNCSRVRFNIKY